MTGERPERGRDRQKEKKKRVRERERGKEGPVKKREGKKIGRKNRSGFAKQGGGERERGSGKKHGG